MNQIEIVNQLDLLIEQIDQGESEALIHYIEIKNLIECFEGALKKIKDQALREALQYNRDVYRGYEIQVREGGGRYSYDHLPEWNKLKDQIKDLEKRAQMALKLHEKGDLMITDGGEIIDPAHFKLNEPSILFKLKK